jgi:protein disulfide-isomerase A6
MLLAQLLAGLTFGASVASAALFTSDSKVKMIDPKGFKKVMKQNRTSLVAFVAPWCGHCQKMVPEFSKAAASLHPLLPLYAVDCDAQQNKRICSEQGVQGFPTVKLFPRGGEVPPITYEGPRSAGSFVNWASQQIPHKIKKLEKVDDITKWASKNTDKPRALLLTKDVKIPLVWKALGNRWRDHFEFATHVDKQGSTFTGLGFDAADKGNANVVVYPAESKDPARYEGANKYEPLSMFMKSIVDGTADLKVLSKGGQVKDEL